MFIDDVCGLVVIVDLPGHFFCGGFLGADGRLHCDLFRCGFLGVDSCLLGRLFHGCFFGLDSRLRGYLFLCRNSRCSLFLAVRCHDSFLLVDNRVARLADIIYMLSNDLDIKSIRTKGQPVDGGFGLLSHPDRLPEPCRTLAHRLRPAGLIGAA